MPNPIQRNLPRDPDVGEGGGHPTRHRTLRRSNRFINSSRRALDADNGPYQRPADTGATGGLTRAASEASALCTAAEAIMGRTASASLPALAPPAPRGMQALRGLFRSGSGVISTTPAPDMRRLPESVWRAGERFLDGVVAVARMATASPNPDTESSDDEQEAVRDSYSRRISALRALPPGDDAELAAFLAHWEQTPIFDASCADLTRFRPDDLPRSPTTMAASMLEREAAVDDRYAGGEMVEAEIRRATAEQSCAVLQQRFADAAARCPRAVDKLRAFIRSFPDKDRRVAAMRVMDARIDPRTPPDVAREQLVYSSISGLCSDMGLRDLAALIWVAIQAAPGTPKQRADRRALLLYNLADCAREADFVCVNGTFQRLLAPLDGVYPGVRTLRRTPFEVVQQVSLTWRAAIAAGERGNNDADWQAFADACAGQAAAYFERDMPLYAMIERQLASAVRVYRDALAQETA